MPRPGHASATVLGAVSQPPEPQNGGYRLRVAVIERKYDSATRTKTERTDWFWLVGKGTLPALRRGDMVLAEVRLRSKHDPGPPPSESVELQIERLVAIERDPPPPSRPSSRGQPRKEPSSW